MSCGILEEPYSRLFKEINNGCPHCDECRFERSDFKTKDKTKDKKVHDSFSNRLPGFSSEKINRQIDVLIVGQAHGGGYFRKQRELDFEVSEMARYYRCPPDKTFHQKQIRILLDKLDNMGLIWVFTDLIKCFVWHGADKENGLYGIKNWGKAIIYCGKYLEEQIRLLQPRKIIGLGGTVAQNFGLDKPEHGSIHSIRINSVYVHSIFPAQWTADLWVAKNGWEPVIQKLVE